MRLVGLALLCAVSVCWSPSWAYEEIAVTDGGTIKGTVTMTGGKPTPKGYNLITFPIRSIAVAYRPERGGEFLMSFQWLPGKV